MASGMASARLNKKTGGLNQAAVLKERSYVPRICEQSFESRNTRERARPMKPERSPVEPEPAREELREEQMKDPVVRERLRRIFEEARKGEQRPGVTAEELPEFLREHGQ